MSPDVPSERDPRLDPREPRSSFATLLSDWLLLNASVWVGTAGELLTRVRGALDERYEPITELSPSDLVANVLRSVDELRSCGVEAEIRDEKPLRQICLRAIGAAGLGSPGLERTAPAHSQRFMAEVVSAAMPDVSEADNRSTNQFSREELAAVDELLRQISDRAV